jgi:hypothetical protein
MAAGDYIGSTDELYRRLRNATGTERPDGVSVGAGKPITGQQIYDRFIRPDEERNVQRIMGGLKQSNQQGRALAQALNSDTAKRMGFSGTSLESALGSSMNSAQAQRQAAAYQDARERLLQMNSDPSRFDVLRRANEAVGQRINRDTIGNNVWAGVDAAVGSGLQAAGGPFAGLGAAIQAIGAGRAAHMSAGLGAIGAEQAQNLSPSNIEALDLSKLASGIPVGGTMSGQSAAGFQGAGQQRASAYRRALDDEYGYGGGGFY